MHFIIQSLRPRKNRKNNHRKPHFFLKSPPTTHNKRPTPKPNRAIPIKTSKKHHHPPLHNPYPLPSPPTLPPKINLRNVKIPLFSLFSLIFFIRFRKFSSSTGEIDEKAFSKLVGYFLGKKAFTY